MTAMRILTLLTALCLLLSLLGCSPQTVDGLCVEVLDVGQSDCTLIRTQGHTLMIDAGTATEREAVRGHLRDRGIRQIDYLLLTHPHEDHIGNARMLIETDTVGALIVSPMGSEELGYQLILNAAAEHELPVYTAKAGDTYAIGDATLEILLAMEAAEEVNDASIVCRVTYGETAFLFTGDAEQDGEAALLASVPAEKLDCDFLKAGHHGSDTSTGEALLQVATPTHVAISCGEDNDYGFPHKALLERLEAMGATWHRTDTEGTLIYQSDGTAVRHEKE